MKLIWERRCGRGNANQIYLAQVELTNESAGVYESVPFVSTDNEAAPARSVETACLDGPDVIEDTYEQGEAEPVRSTESTHQDLQKPHVLTCGNGTSGSAEIACQDLRNPHTRNNNINNTEKSYIDSQSVSPVRVRDSHAQRDVDRRTDDELAELDEILEGCELYVFCPVTAKVFESAIERLFFSENYRIGNCVLPQKKVRSHLRALDYIKLQTAEIKIARNTEKEIRNSTAYMMAVIFNSIWETESDLMNDPYLNSLRTLPAPEHSHESG